MRGRAGAFGMCFWKEWRDHRAVLAGMYAAVPLVLAILGVALPSRMFGHEGFAGYTAVACLAIFVISLTTDLAPGEARRGHRAFLERLPGGLGAAVPAKALLFATGAAHFSLFGYAAGLVTCRVVTGAWPPAPPPFGPAPWILAVAALWTFAVSCSLPRGALSLPATAALALLLGSPILVVSRIEPSWGPSPWWRWESAALWGIGGVVAAWLGFRSRGLRAARACLAVGAVCAMPYWADAAHYALRPEPSIAVCHLGEGGRYAFVDLVRKARRQGGRALPPVIVDLETGTAREVESAHRWFRPLSGWGTPQRHVQLGGAVYDARTGELVRPTAQELQEGRRAATRWRLPDGRRVWPAGERLEAEAAGGGVEVLEERWPGGNARGLGFDVPRGFYDPTRRRFYGRSDIAIRAYKEILIRPGRWLVQRRPGLRFELYDPEADSLAPARGLGPGDRVGGMLDDGRVFVTRGRALVLVDPGAGSATPVPAPAGVRVWDAGMRTPDGRRVLRLFFVNGNAPLLARFDPSTGALAPTAPLGSDGHTGVLGCPTDEEVLVHDDGAIYRLRFGSDLREEIWRVR